MTKTAFVPYRRTKKAETVPKERKKTIKVKRPKKSEEDSKPAPRETTNKSSWVDFTVGDNPTPIITATTPQKAADLSDKARSKAKDLTDAPPTPKGVKANKFQKLVGKLVELAGMVANKKPYQYQKEFLYRFFQAILLRDAVTLTVLISRQAGKTEGVGIYVTVVAIILPFLAVALEEDEYFSSFLNRLDEQGNYRGYRNGVRIGIYAPSKDQARITFNRVKTVLSTNACKEILQELGIEIDTWNGDTVLFSNGSSVKAASAAPTAKVEGGTLELLILEEAQDLEDFVIRKSLRPFVASTKGLVIMIGTCGVKVCEFYNKIQSNVGKYLSHRTLPNHFEYDYKICGKYNSFYRDYVEGEKEELGEESDEFQLSYALRWKISREMFVTPELMRNPKIGLLTGPFSDIQTSSSYAVNVVAGIDFGKVKDSTVVTVAAVDWSRPVFRRLVVTSEGEKEVTAYNKHIIGWLELTGTDYEKQFPIITAYLKNFLGLRRIVLDATGVGEALYDRYLTHYADTPEVQVVPFNFAPLRNSEGYKLTQSELVRGRITYPNSAKANQDRRVRKFRKQLLAAVKSFSASGLMCVEAPPKEHDDYVTSLMLMTQAAELGPDESGAVVAANPFFGKHRR